MPSPASARIPDDELTCYCPCCDTKLAIWGVARFLERPDLYDVRRYKSVPQDVVCPVCGTIPRHRIIAWHLRERPELVHGKRMLHFAPERGLSLWFDRQGIQRTTADLLNSADLRIDCQDTGLPNGSFDVVVQLDVIIYLFLLQ